MLGPTHLHASGERKSASTIVCKCKSNATSNQSHPLSRYQRVVSSIPLSSGNAARWAISFTALVSSQIQCCCFKSIIFWRIKAAGSCVNLAATSNRKNGTLSGNGRFFQFSGDSLRYIPPRMNDAISQKVGFAHGALGNCRWADDCNRQPIRILTGNRLSSEFASRVICQWLRSRILSYLPAIGAWTDSRQTAAIEEPSYISMFRSARLNQAPRCFAFARLYSSASNVLVKPAR